MTQHAKMPRVVWGALFTLTVAHLALGLSGIGRDDLWYDEALTGVYAQTGDPRFLRYEGGILHLPLIRAWSALFGTSEIALRIPSALSSAADVPLTFLVAGLWLPAVSALFTAALVAFSPLLLWYAQEARFWSLTVTLTLLVVWSFVRACRKGSWGSWLLYAVLNALGIYLNLILLVLLPAFVVLLLSGWCRSPEGGSRASVGQWTGATLASLLLALPWLWDFGWRFWHARDLPFWPPVPTLGSLAATLGVLGLGYTAPWPALYTATAVVWGCFVVLGFLLTKQPGRQALCAALTLLVIPIALVFVASQWKSLYVERRLVELVPFYFLAVVAALVRLPWRSAQLTAVLGAFLVFGVCDYHFYRGRMSQEVSHHRGVHAKKPIRHALETLLSEMRPEDSVALTSRAIQTPFEYYLRRQDSAKGALRELFRFYLLPVENPVDPFSQAVLLRQRTGSWPQVVNLAAQSLPESTRFAGLAQARRVWLVGSSWEQEGELDENSRLVRERMETFYERRRERWIDGILIGLYEKADSADSTGK